MDIAWEMPNPNFQYYVEALGGTEVSLGIIGLASFLGMAIVAFPGGYLADKCGRQKLISVMSFGIALSFLFFALAPTWEFILLGTISSSLCLIYQPALFAMVQDSLPPERRGMGSSLIELIHGTFNTWTNNRRISVTTIWISTQHENHLLDYDSTLSNCSNMETKIKRNPEK